MRDPPHVVPRGVPNVVAHAPAGFDARAPLHLVVYFHGAVQSAALIANVGMVVYKEGAPPLPGEAFVARHDYADTNSLFVVPQFAFLGGGDAGRMGDRSYFRTFLTELVTDTFADAIGPHTLDDVEDVTIIAHSAGWHPVVALLDRAEPEMIAKIRNVVLLDAFYEGGLATYERWLDADDPAAPRRRFVLVFSAWGDAGGNGKALATHVARTDPDRVAYDPKAEGALADEIARSRVVVYGGGLDHYWIPTMLFTKLVAALGLPARPHAAPPPEIDLARTRPIARGEVAHGKLTADGHRIETGIVADDWTIDLDAGAPIVATAKGGKSDTEPSALDVVLRVYRADTGELVAEDDDRAGQFGARVALRAPAAGRYVLRVTTPIPWQRFGPYTLAVE